MWLHIRAPKKIQNKMNLQLILSKNSPRAHMELKFNVLGVAEKLMKYLVHLSKRKNQEKNLSFHRMPKQQTTSFCFKEF
jgi:hypothetical protein